MKFTNKLTVLFISTSGFIISVMLAIVYFQVAGILEREISSRMETRAIVTMNALDRFLSERSDDIKIVADDLVISSGDATAEQIAERLIFFRNTYKWYASLSFFNLERVRIADTSGMKIGEQAQMTRYFEDVFSGQVSVASDIHISESLKEPAVYFASLVKNKEGKTIGVVVARILTNRLFEIIKGNEKIQQEEKIDIVNTDHLLIYSNHNFKGILKENLSEWESIESSHHGKIAGSAKHYHPDEEKLLYAFCVEQGYLDFKGNDWTIIYHIPTRVVFSPVNSLLKGLISMFLIMLFGLVFVIHFFSKTVTRPLIRLSAAAEEIGKGKLDTVIEIKSKDEFGSLSSNINRMAKNLKKAQDEIIRSEKLAVVGQLASSVAHELRNPLGVIKNAIYYLNMLELGKDSPDIKENLEIIAAEIENSNKVINDLLEFSRIKQPVLRPENINVIVREIIHRLNFSDEIKVVTELADKLPDIAVDALQMQQVFYNLASNAIQAMEKGGMLTISSSVVLCPSSEKERDADCVAIAFKDTGCGIPKENLQKIFEPLFSTKAKGTGLGLSVVASLVEGHGGKIGVESEAGQGSTFTVKLPIKH